MYGMLLESVQHFVQVSEQHSSSLFDYHNRCASLACNMSMHGWRCFGLKHPIWYWCLMLEWVSMVLGIVELSFCGMWPVDALCVVNMGDGCCRHDGIFKLASDERFNIIPQIRAESFLQCNKLFLLRSFPSVASVALTMKCNIPAKSISILATEQTRWQRMLLVVDGNSTDHSQDNAP